MPLPKTDQPIFTITQPSTGKELNFRPFLVKEEKILLMGLQSDNQDDVVRSILQVLRNCIVDDVDVESFTTFDFDFMFLKLRAQSVNNVITVKYHDPVDENDYEIKIDLNHVKAPDVNMNKTVEVGKLKIKLRYPTIMEMIKINDKLEEFRERDEPLPLLSDLLLEHCIEKIWDAETVYDEYSPEELTEWIDQLPPSQFATVRDFLSAIPDIEYTAKYKRKDKSTGEVVLRGIDDFFTLR